MKRNWLIYVIRLGRFLIKAKIKAKVENKAKNKNKVENCHLC